MINQFPRFIRIALTILYVLIWPAAAGAAPENNGAVANAAKRLIQFCADPRTGLDNNAVAVLMDYVLGPKSGREAGLQTMDGCQGAYYEFDTRISYPRFLSYSYNLQVPAALTRPSSLRYSIWTSLQGKATGLRDKWKPVSPSDQPEIIHGIQRDCITPDLTTGIYYEYDLKRTLIHFNYKGRQALISISKQVSESEVGKRGLIGSDDEWSYYYSNETGSFKTGLGWVKSYIFDYFSIGVYVEANGSSNLVRSGTFQWLRAGWSGINFVKTEHIMSGLKRFARNSRAILESPKLPAPSQFIRNYQLLCALPGRDLNDRYAALQKARHSLAVRAGKIPSGSKPGNGNNASKEQMVQELMLEYLKISLGKPYLVDKNICSASNSAAPQR